MFPDARIHMIYFPWDREQRLVRPTDVFDRAPYETMVRYAHPMPVELWTHDRAIRFCQKEYPEIHAVLERAARPVMLVDVLRWVIVYHFGGIFWQYNTIPLAPMAGFLPSDGKRVRLFTEFELNEGQCRQAASQPIREGAPEESIRILIQVFSALPRANFLKRTIDLMLERVKRYEPRCDYDILFITGNAAASTAFDRFGKEDAEVERIGLTESRKRIKWLYRGSWRTDVPATAAAPPRCAGAEAFLFTAPARSLFTRSIQAAWHHWGRKHLHEVVLARSRDEILLRRSDMGPGLRAAFEELGVRSVLDLPCGTVSKEQVAGVSRYLGGDPDREVVRANRAAAVGRGVSFRHIHPIFSPLPAADLLLCTRFLEHLPYREMARVFACLKGSRIRHVGFSTHPLLPSNWDSALGDVRPLNLEQAPFDFPPPACRVEAPLPGGRPDRCVAIWQAGILNKAAVRGPRV